MRARCAGTLFKGFQRGHSSTYTLQAVLCQMLGTFGTLVSDNTSVVNVIFQLSMLMLYTCDVQGIADGASALMQGCRTQHVQ
jgi:hypothetical protein